MRDAAMPSEQKQVVVRKKITKHIRVRENGAEHQRPGDDAPLIDGDGREEIAATKSRFADERTCDAVGDGVHGVSTNSALEDRNERRSFLPHTADAFGVHAVRRERGERPLRVVRCNGNQ